MREDQRRHLEIRVDQKDREPDCEPEALPARPASSKIQIYEPERHEERGVQDDHATRLRLVAREAFAQALAPAAVSR